MFSLPQAAILAHHAEAMNDAGTLTPPLPPEVAAEWDLIGYLTAKDATLAERIVGRGERVYFGFVALHSVSKSETEYVVVIRGTEPLSFTEWLEDGLALMIRPAVF
jgi:hypothetical protein